MSFRITDAWRSFNAGLKTSIKAALRLRAGFFTGLLAATLLWPQTGAAVPVGTAIDNTAIANYLIDGTPQLPLSATHQFTVEGLGITDSGTIAVTTGPATQNIYAGDSTTLGIELNNTGDNTLANGEVHITAPVNTQISLTGNGVTPISQTSSATTTTQTFTVTDLSSGSTENLQATLTLPVQLDPDNNQIVIEHIANNETISSETVQLNLKNRTNGQLEILQYASSNSTYTEIIKITEYDQGDGTFTPALVPELPDTGALVTDAPVTLEKATEFSHNQILFVRIADNDHNHDDAVNDTIDVDFNIPSSNETETIRLTETSADSGVFTGYLKITKNAATANNGELNVSANTQVSVNYCDNVDTSDVTTNIIIVDPFGVVIDSSTGARLNGYTVHLINSNTGLPATVYGDDGVSIYPSTVVTGGTVTDASGATYDFADGEYRFPFAATGNYQIHVVPPAGALYRWPSSKQPDSSLINLPGGPYEITLGSRGESFLLPPGPPLHIDIPIDPLSSQMYVQRTADKDNVGPGDFIQFRTTLENVTNVALNNVILTDTLPHGFRFEKNSVLLDGVASTDPAIASDGTTLTFNLGNIAADTSYTIEYVASVGAVKQSTVTSSSHATANNGLAESNTATLENHIIEELMFSRAILMGRVIIDPPENPGDVNPEQPTGLKGIRVYMEDGRYAITDKRGMYHFDNITPGSHVVQLDLDTLPEKYEVSTTQQNTRFAGQGWSQFVDVQGGTLWRTDFHVKKKPAPEGNVDIQITSKQAQTEDDVEYKISLSGSNIPLEKLRLIVFYPEGASYIEDSSQINQKAIKNPSDIDNTLTFRLGKVNGEWNKDISFKVGKFSEEKQTQQTKAFLMFDTPTKRGVRSQIAEHSLVFEKTIREHTIEEYSMTHKFKPGSAMLTPNGMKKLSELMQQLPKNKELFIHVVGHTDNVPPKNPVTIRRHKDNYGLSRHRAFVVANYLHTAAKLPAENISFEGKGPDKPIADNNTEKGREKNRRVHIYVYSKEKQLVSKTPPKAISGDKQKTIIKGAYSENTKAPAVPNKDKAELNYDSDWLARQNAAIEWISPNQDALPSIPSTKVIIKHHFSHKVKLLLNGEQVSALNLDGTLRNNQGPAITTWLGVDLIEGDNTFEAIFYDQEDLELQRMKQVIHYSSPPVKTELIKDQSILVADGITKPVIAIRFTDKDEYPARKGLTGQFKINQPYTPYRDSEFAPENMPGAPQSLHEYHIGENGIALITLEPTTQAGDLIIKLPLADNREDEIETRLKAKTRDWIIVGIAEGTAGYNDLKGNIQELEGDPAENHLYQDGRIALFAKGQVIGKWLLTLAYDSDKERPNDSDPNMFQKIDPGSLYTVYGDNGSNGFDAASSEKLYLKLERDEFYFLFGDYTTDLNDIELTQYNRSLTGIKSRYQDDKYDVVIFSSETNQAFVRDEFRGKSITGPYQLTRKNIAMNSEKIVIEVRDRFHSENIIDTQEMSRHSDYDINYRDGTVTFRKPVLSVDDKLNPAYIIVKYESYDSNDQSVTYGGRAEVAVTDSLSVGVTHVNEGRTGGDAKLGGADVTYQITDNTQVKLEAAHTINSKETDTNAKGSAYLAEVEHQSNNTNARIYISEQEDGFGIGQTNGSENGMRKGGAEASVRASEHITLKGQAYRQENTVTEATRDVAEAESQVRISNTTLHAGARGVRDERGDGTKQDSDQITAGISQSLLNNRVNMHIDREHNIKKGNSIDYPNKTSAGVDVKVSKNTSLFIEQEITDGEIRDTRNTLTGIKSTPWSGGEIYTGVTKSSSTAGESTSANVAMSQRWLLNDAWSLDIAAEESRTLSSSSGIQLNNNIPFANGNSEDFTAGSLGVTYNPGDWVWNIRLESRDGDLDDRNTLATSIQTTPYNNLSMLLGLSLSESDQATGEEQQAVNISLGLAYRPTDSRWIVLDKLELKWNENLGSSFDNKSWRIINNLNLNYSIERWQLSLQYAAKSVQETINTIEYSSYVDLTGFETRYDITSRWDIGMHGSVLHAWDLKHYDYSSGLSVGHSVANNIWISLGYNFVGFRDEDFSASRYTSKGMFLRFRLKFDQASLRDAVKWASQ